MAAALHVTADVSAWESFTLTESAALEDLADLLRARATQMGIEDDRPLVFRTATVLPEIDGHVIDGSKISPNMSHAERHERAVAIRRFSAEPAMLVGFVSRGHEGIFTHRGEAIHAHAVLAAAGMTVHVDAVVVPAGSMVEFGVERAADCSPQR